ncbi:FAD-binding oxidoreductase [Roseovarius sp. EL26]|uniref:NAD(P)/FAD-dependent oxidoreductase n=1 Tax=Roseovarius sp. EL26 TaxID=2126672 RepID=UPI000EA29620|nr:FAD-binding oxidoreductase [Roseovarius sp. EL26]
MKIHRLPKDDNTNGWSAVIPARKPHYALKDDINSDWVVLGAGYAGLAAARRLAENCPDQKVVVVEAGQVGENASGRNSGFAIDLPHNVGSSLEELEGSHRFMRLARMAIDQLESTVKLHNISCDWVRAGKFHTAVSSRGRQNVLEPFAKELEALKEPFEWVEGATLEQRLGSPHFNAAIYTPGCALMNPAALVRGLADNLPDNVTLVENSPVVEASFQNGIKLSTPRGSVRAPKMVMGANGFSEQFGFFNRRFLHLVAHASLTRPLTEQERANFGVVEQWGLTPANAFAGITMRYTNDHRILIRQGLSYCPSQRVATSQQAAIRRNHIALFKNRFPSIANVDMEHTWSGFVCLSRNGAPGFGQLTPNIWSAVCQNAVGVTKGTFGGILAADMATGRENPLISDMQSLGQPDMLPPRPFLDVGVRARFGWELWTNRNEA